MVRRDSDRDPITRAVFKSREIGADPSNPEWRRAGPLRPRGEQSPLLSVKPKASGTWDQRRVPQKPAPPRPYAQ